MHPRSGELLLIAEDGYWFAYPWWENEHEAPDFARHVDIHNKPGYDPVSFFSADGCHLHNAGSQQNQGDTREGREESPSRFCLDIAFEKTPASLLELSRLVANWLDDCGRSDL